MVNNETPVIVTLDHSGHCLTQRAAALPDSADGLAEAKQIVARLVEALRPRMPAAGLAAPQIGISKQVFIFSWDRSPAHLQSAINPSFVPASDEKQAGWEGCFSVPLALAKVPRFQSISATFTNELGERVHYHFQGFAARVFQHEYDHLQGLENIHREDAEVKHFENAQAMMEFIQEVKKGDVVNYIEPVLMD